MHLFRILFIVSGVSVVTVAQGSQTLCNSEEQSVFSCAIKTKSNGVKIASLCASNNLSESAGFLYYRFGSEHRVEMSFPDSPVHPKEHFTWGLMDFSDANGDFVRFSQGEYSYTVYSWAKGNPSANGEGVTVRKRGELIRELHCVSTALSDKGWSAIYKAKLPHDESREP